MSFYYQSVLVEVMKISLFVLFDEKRETKKERKKNPLGNEIMLPAPPLTEKGEKIDVLIGSVGTDGARTRSFRLDRAVL
jgi:hypothetical protein